MWFTAPYPPSVLGEEGRGEEGRPLPAPRAAFPSPPHSPAARSPGQVGAPGPGPAGSGVGCSWQCGGRGRAGRAPPGPLLITRPRSPGVAQPWPARSRGAPGRAPPRPRGRTVQWERGVPSVGSGSWAHPHPSPRAPPLLAGGWGGGPTWVRLGRSRGELLRVPGTSAPLPQRGVYVPPPPTGSVKINHLGPVASVPPLPLGPWTLTTRFPSSFLAKGAWC